jgi:hypothetical protein
MTTSKLSIASGRDCAWHMEAIKLIEIVWVPVWQATSRGQASEQIYSQIYKIID